LAEIFPPFGKTMVTVFSLLLWNSFVVTGHRVCSESLGGGLMQSLYH
jgi:hypothetical protein